MLIKKIPDSVPSLWERVWEGIKTGECREVIRHDYLVEENYPVYRDSKVSDIPKYDRAYGIGCPARYFDTNVDATGDCIHDCHECWEKDWEGEEFRC